MSPGEAPRVQTRAGIGANGREQMRAKLGRQSRTSQLLEERGVGTLLVVEHLGCSLAWWPRAQALESPSPTHTTAVTSGR